MFGAGPEGALKAIQVSCYLSPLFNEIETDEQWELLRHSYTSPLASIEQGKGDES